LKKHFTLFFNELFEKLCNKFDDKIMKKPGYCSEVEILRYALGLIKLLDFSVSCTRLKGVII